MGSQYTYSILFLFTQRSKNFACRTIPPLGSIAGFSVDLYEGAETGHMQISLGATVAFMCIPPKHIGGEFDSFD